METKCIKVRYVEMKMNNIRIFTFPMLVKDLATISYVAVRGRDEEEGAVQRVLNRKRISSIKQYVLEGNMFVNTFIINWNDEKFFPSFSDENVEIPIVPNVAQLLDGQHRLEGIKEAANVDESVNRKQVLVSMVIGLNTKEAAKIFTNINSEQKPVPKSLIYDLYGITDEERNFAITRSDDIAKELNDNIDSPYYNLIKFPGSSRNKGKIDLSTVVSSLKNYVDVGGKFVDNNIKDFNAQTQIIINYFNTLKYYWDQDNLWNNASQNVFFKAAGFTAAMEFFFEYVFAKCVDKRSFKLDYLISLFDFSDVDLITINEIKGTDGKTARKMIVENLKEGLKKDIPQENDYEY